MGFFTSGDLPIFFFKINKCISLNFRPSSPSLAKSVIDGVLALSGKPIDYGIVTTPQMHYFVKCRNTQYEYGQPTEEGYYTKLVTAFKNLRNDKITNGNYTNKIFYDGANGVGAKKIKYFQERLGNLMQIQLYNDAGIGTGKLNYLVSSVTLVTKNCICFFCSVVQITLNPNNYFRLVYLKSRTSGVCPLMETPTGSCIIIWMRKKIFIY